MQHVWVLTKSYPSPSSGGLLPIAWSYGYNHSHMGFEDNGWGLVWITLDIHQLIFLKSGSDPNVEVVGVESDVPTPLLLETYAEKLTGAGPFNTLQQVLTKLGEWEPRFWLQRDAKEP